jgi:Flp pilus assembly protein TadG
MRGTRCSHVDLIFGPFAKCAVNHPLWHFAYLAPLFEGLNRSKPLDRGKLDMLKKVKRLMKSLRRNISGNAMILLAMGMPVVIGGAGLAIDTARWYMWQREMQYAVDQAALAGAWARTVTATQATYSSRALQEYSDNMQMADAFDATPTISLVNYNGGTNNAVTVAASASKKLPFSSFLTKDSAITVSVTATASVTPGVAGTSTTTVTPSRSACVIALNPTASGALTLAGSASGLVSCGGAALSNNPTAAIDELGNPNVLFGSLSATGGIASSLTNNVTGGLANIFANQAGLSDPFAGVSQPTGSGVARSYPSSCPVASAGSTTYTATTSSVTYTSYVYVTGNNSSQATSNAQAGTNSYAYSPPRAGSQSGATVANNVTVTSSNTNGTFVDSTPVYTYQSQVLASPKVHEVKKVYTRTTYSNFTTTVIPATSSTVTLQPGTYSTITMACDTKFNPGIYVVTGSIDFSQNRTITGADVLFVMTTANNVSNINSNTNIDLTGISSSTLTGTYGYSATNAGKLAGMLFWDTLSTSQIKINGNSTSKLNGTLYMPKRSFAFQGNSSISGYCMMLIADTITFTGSNDMNTFCQTSGANIPQVRPQTSVTTTTAATPAVVRLVS